MKDVNARIKELEKQKESIENQFKRVVGIIEKSNNERNKLINELISMTSRIEELKFIIEEEN